MNLINYVLNRNTSGETSTANLTKVVTSGVYLGITTTSDNLKDTTIN